MPQSPSYTNVGRVSDIGRGEMSIDRQPVRLYYCEGQCLRKKVVPADRAGTTVRTRSVSGGMENVVGKVNRSVSRVGTDAYGSPKSPAMRPTRNSATHALPGPPR